MNKPIANKDSLERLIDELGLKSVLALIAAICTEKGEKAKAVQGYNSDPCRKFMQAGARIRATIKHIEC